MPADRFRSFWPIRAFSRLLAETLAQPELQSDAAKNFFSFIILGPIGGFIRKETPQTYVYRSISFHLSLLGPAPSHLEGLGPDLSRCCITTTS